MEDLFIFCYDALKIIFRDLLFTKLFSRSRNNKTKALLLKILCFTFISIIVVSLIYIVVLLEDFWASLFNFANPTISLISGISVALFYVSVVIFLLFSIYKIAVNRVKFVDFREETACSKNNRLFENHKVLLVLDEDIKNIFVFAHFEERNEIRPAVFTKHGNKIGFCNIREEHFTQKIIKDGKIIKLCKIINKSTQTAMLVLISQDEVNVNFKNINFKKVNYSSLDYNIYTAFISLEEYKNISEIYINNIKFKLNNWNLSYPYIYKQYVEL